MVALVAGLKASPTASVGPSFSSAAAQNQEFDLLIRSGHVIDPRNAINAVMDVAVTGSKVALVAANIAPARARQVVDATGLYVTPGLIDIHAHVFWGHDEESQYSDGYSAVQPDSHSFRAGQTTLVDVGGAGWRSFPKFKEQVIDRSQTRILSFLNIVGSGMRGGPVEQNLSDMDAKLTAMRIRQHPGLIVGVKVAHYNGPEWDPVTRAVAAGRETNVPVMVDFGGHTPPLSLEDLLMKHLRPGDILTHTYAHVGGRIPIVDENGKVRPFCLGGAEARRHLRRGPWRRQLSVPAGGPRDEGGIPSRRDQHRSAHREPEQRHEGHPEHDVEVPEHGHAARGRHQGQHFARSRHHQAHRVGSSRRRR